MITRLIPKLFFNRMSDGLDLFVECLGFKVLHQTESLAVVERDTAKAYVIESAEYASRDRPEIALETDSIDELYSEISAMHRPLAKEAERGFQSAQQVQFKKSLSSKITSL